MILVLPWYPVYHLQMLLRHRLAVCGMFLLGSFVVAVGIGRVVFISKSFQRGTDTSCWCSSPNAVSTPFVDLNIPDMHAPAFYWASVQSCVGVVSACLPTMRPLIRRIDQSLLSQFVRSRYSRLMSRLTRPTNGNHTQYEDLGDGKSEASLVREV